jgi:hypothetical protein
MKLFKLALAALLACTLAVPAPAFAADLAVTAANVVASGSAATRQCTAGATITAGQVVYRDSADGKCKLADNNSATAAARAPIGVALNGAANGQPLQVATEGPVTIGATLTAGVAYYLSGTAGGICPVADLTTGMYPSIVGIATSASVLDIKVHSSGVAL